jgi:hypothetical protein
LKGYLPYADAAISSHRQFRELRDAGELPRDLRFQVALPTPHAAIGGYFVRDWPMLQAAYHDAIVDDISRMLEPWLCGNALPREILSAVILTCGGSDEALC